MGIAVRPVLWEIAALYPERKAEDSRVKMIRIFRCITAGLSRLSKQFSRVRCPSATTGAALIAKIEVKRTAFASAPESSQPYSHCVVVAAVDRQMNSRQANATRNRVVQVTTDII